MKFSAKFLGIILGGVLFLFLFSEKTEAARSLSFTTDKTVLNGDEQISVTASISGFTNGETIYIKGAFYKDGTSNYFGLTQNGSDWIKNSTTATSQRQITIGNWDGNLIVRPDFTDTGFTNYGDGSYKFKVGFYYGSFSSVNWSTNTIDVSMTAPAPTQVPTSVPTNTPVPSSTPTSTPTPINSPSSTPVPTVIKNTTIFPTTVITEISPTDQVTQAVLGENSEISPSPKISPILIASAHTLPWIGIIMVAFGIIVMGGCAILIFHPIEFEKLWPFKK